MERLTEGTPQEPLLIDDTFKGYNEAFRKLYEYEDLEEQGRLIKLPCKVGDTVYHIHYLPNNNKWVISEDENVSLYYIAVALQEKSFGNTIFPTQAEAAEKIKQMSK